MPEQQIQTDEVQIDTTAISKGKITVFGNVSNPTPTILARATKALRYFSVSLITMVSATDLFSGGQAKIISFCLGVFILLLGGVDIVIGVEPTDKKIKMIRPFDEYPIRKKWKKPDIKWLIYFLMLVALTILFLIWYYFIFKPI